MALRPEASLHTLDALGIEGALPWGATDALSSLLGSRGSSSSLPEAAAMTPTEKLAKDFRHSVVRIQTIERTFNWFKPFLSGSDEAYIGTGFAVHLAEESGDQEDPIFITNAHVVLNCHTVIIQMPSVGQREFAAYVPLIYEDFDLAIVRLQRPKEFVDYLQNNTVDLQVHSVKKDVALAMGSEVAALGFPLGSDSLKLSRGIIAGTERVAGRLSYQSTAPISPGSSGGPLFAVREEGSGHSVDIIGVNYAASAEKDAENANYVVPLVHMRQILHEFKEIQSQFDQSPRKQVVESHKELRLAPVDIIGVETNEALFETSNGCTSGYFIAQVPEGSVLSGVVPNGAFLVSVNGHTLDRYGMARMNDFLGDPLLYDSLMCLADKVEDQVNLTICEQGNHSEKQVSMAWQERFASGVQPVFEPFFNERLTQYETFAGITVMQKTMNHEGHVGLHPDYDYDSDDSFHEGLHTHPKGHQNRHRSRKGLRQRRTRVHHAERHSRDETHGAEMLQVKVTGEGFISQLVHARHSKHASKQSLDDPMLIIVDAREGSYANRVLRPGSVVAEINGNAVATLADYRDAFALCTVSVGAESRNSTGVWELVTDDGVVFQTNYTEAMQEQVRLISAGMTYLKTDAINAVISAYTEKPKAEAGEPQVADLVNNTEVADALQQGDAAAAKGEGEPKEVPAQTDKAAPNGKTSRVKILA